MPEPHRDRPARRPMLTSALQALALASARLQPDDIAAVVAEEATRAGATEVTIYLADLEQRWLVPLGSPSLPVPETLAIDATIAGRAYRTERPVTGRREADGETGGAGGQIAWMPLMDSAERIGVVAIGIAGDFDDDLLTQCNALSGFLGEMIANKADYGDIILRTRRTQELSVAAEMRWQMLPALTYSGRNLTVSGIVEPVYSVAGDSFDYAVNGDTAHVAIIDAIGHGLEAARIADLAVIAYRHSRRRGLSTVETYRAMDRVLCDQLEPDEFTTAQLATLTLSTGRLAWLNAGHPPPMVIRRGHRFDLASPVSLPVGLSGVHEGSDPQQGEVFLEPHDLVLFFSDGVVEARAPSGEEFGRERLADLMVRAAASAEPTAEIMRRAGHAVLAHQEGVLQDDATLLAVTWHGAPPPAGASPVRSAGVDVGSVTD